MTRNIIAVIIIIVILSLGICEQVFIVDSFTKLHDKALVIENYIIGKDYDNAILSANDLLEWWRKRRDILELTSPHNEVKDHVTYLAQLLGYLISEQYDDALVTTYSIREDAHNKMNILTYRVKNVL